MDRDALDRLAQRCRELATRFESLAENDEPTSVAELAEYTSAAETLANLRGRVLELAHETAERVRWQ